MSTSAIASSEKIQTALTNLGIPDGFIAYDTVPLLRQLVVALGNVQGNPGGGITQTAADARYVLKAAGSFTGLTGAGFRDTNSGAGFDVTLGFTSSVALDAGRALTIDMGNVAHTLALGTTAGTITFPNAAALTVAGLQIANVFTALQTITQGTANAGILASTGYSLTGIAATSMIDLAGTWNTTGTPTAFKLNITNTASNAASLFADFQISGTSTIALSRDGRIKGVYNPGFPQFTAVGLETSGMRVYSDRVDFWQAGTIPMTLQGDNINLGTATAINWTSGAIIRSKASATLQLGFDAAGVTNQMLTAASRITSDGVGADLTIAGGNGRGGAGGSLILSTYDTAGAATIGTLRSRMTFDTAGAVAFPVVTAVTTETVVSDTTWPVTINGVSYKILLKA